MLEIINHAVQNGTLNSIILSLLFIYAAFFMTRNWWPDYVKRRDLQQQYDYDLRVREIDADKEVRKLEIQEQLETYKSLIADIQNINNSINAINATITDIFQNIMGQFIEDRQALIDTAVFRNRNRLNKKDGE